MFLMLFSTGPVSLVLVHHFNNPAPPSPIFFPLYLQILKMDRIKRIRRQATEYEKILVKHVPDERRLFKICKELIKLNNKKTNNPNKKIDQRPEQELYQRRHIDGK